MFVMNGTNTEQTHLLSSAFEPGPPVGSVWQNVCFLFLKSWANEAAFTTLRPSPRACTIYRIGENSHVDQQQIADLRGACCH